MIQDELFTVSGYILSRRVVKYMRDFSSVNISRFLKSFEVDFVAYKRTHPYYEVPTYNALYVALVQFTINESKPERFRHFQNALLEFAKYSEFEVYFDSPLHSSVPPLSSQDSHLLQKEELQMALTLAGLQCLID